MRYPLCGFAASPWKGGDTFAAGRPLLGIFGVVRADFEKGCAWLS